MWVNKAPRAMPNINIPSNSRTGLVPITMMYSSETPVHPRCSRSCYEIRTEATPQDHAILPSPVFLMPCPELTAQECALPDCDLALRTPSAKQFGHKPAAALFGFRNSREKFRQICKRRNNNPHRRTLRSE